MTTFFSVDVETSGLTPWHGSLLTVGIQPVLFKEILVVNEDCPPGIIIPEKFYVRIDCTEELEISRKAGGWGNPDNPSTSYGWWIEQNHKAQDEAFRDDSLVRHSRQIAARMIVEFLNEIEPVLTDRIFVANPVSFDKMWLNYLFATTGVNDPFHYQSLCLRSMKFGLRKNSRWVSVRDNHAPLVPHHALHDAYAQAEDLVKMLWERDKKESF